jgi:hypothetical protein
MLQLQHLKRIVDLCHPGSLDEAIDLQHNIKPVKFGNRVGWEEATVSFANYQIPEDSAYMIVLRTECYVFTEVAAAPAFGMFAPPPIAPAFWEYRDVALGTNVSYQLTPTLPLHILCDTDEMLFAKGDHNLSLTVTLGAAPDANARFIRTLVYGYLIGAKIADRIGGNESTYFGSTGG